jgi:hypothetical protein
VGAAALVCRQPTATHQKQLYFTCAGTPAATQLHPSSVECNLCTPFQMHSCQLSVQAAGCGCTTSNMRQEYVCQLVAG